jgi:hypothetical protein
MWCGFRVLDAYKFTGANIRTNPLASTTVAQGKSPGGISLSANGNLASSAIVWGTHDGNGGTLRAYEAVNVTHELWNSQQNAARDALGSYVKFCAPTIADGKVYVSTSASNLVVYGLLTPPYQLWQQANFTPTELADPTISGDTGDPDGDGIPNLAEYAFNTNPKSAGWSGQPVMDTVNVGGSDYLALSYSQVLFNTDITCTVQVSGDLTSGAPGPDSPRWFPGWITAMGPRPSRCEIPRPSPPSRNGSFVFTSAARNSFQTDLRWSTLGHTPFFLSLDE